VVAPVLTGVQWRTPAGVLTYRRLVVALHAIGPERWSCQGPEDISPSSGLAYAPAGIRAQPSVLLQ
jgi:hypothetical protein